MTRVTRLEMKGFKSFANKTELLFGTKFNCVLGPNGSGKSNILDALCFVLGKSSAKGLRAEKSANLIYNGGKSKSPAKHGEVSIYFDNSHRDFGDLGEEVKITRVIKSTGQSVYKVNDQTLTRQQILEVLSKARIDPDGHNVVLQGDIVRLAEMQPDERRKVIEEIAGISIYEDKKNKALRELTRVEEKLNEAHIILTEREAYLKELKVERDQAAKFKELDEKVKKNRATLIDMKLHSRQTELEKQDTRKQKFDDLVSGLDAEIEQLKTDIEKKKEEINAINKEVEQKGEKEQVALHKEVEQLRIDCALNKQRIETLKQEIAKVEERRSELLKTNNELDSKVKVQEKNRKEVEKRIANKEKESALLEKRITEFKQKHKMDAQSDIDQRIVEIDKEAEQLQEDSASLREEQQQLIREKDRIDVILEGIDEKIAKVKSVSDENKAAIAQLKSRKSEFKKSTLELSKAMNQNASIISQLGAARERLSSRNEDVSKLRARSAHLQEAASGSLAVQRILAQKNKIKGIHGTVAELGSVKREYALALEVAAGARMHSIIVENDKVAEQCIRYLKDNRLGVATFLPLNKINHPPINASLKTLRSAGYVGLAVDQVSCDKKFSKAFSYVFGNTIVVENITAARKLGIGKYRMSSVTGELIEMSGAMQGGFRTKKTGAGFKEKETTAELNKLEKEIADLQSVVSRLEENKMDNEQLIERLRTMKAELEGEIIKSEKSLFLDSGDLDADKDQKKDMVIQSKALDKQIDKVSDDLSDKTRELAKLKMEKEQHREKIMAMRNPRVLAELNTFEDKKKDLHSEVLELRGEIKNAQSEMANILGPELMNIQKILKQHEKEKTQFDAERQKLVATVKDQEADLKRKEEEEKKFFAQFKELFNHRGKLNDEVGKAENAISNKRDMIRDNEHKANAISLEIARIRAEIVALEEEAKPFEGVERFKSKPEADIKKEIAEFEKMLQNFGAVNLKALEIYDSVQEEYEKLVGKREKLTTEREDVLVMINEIDTRKKDLFMLTYEVVSSNFSKIFSSLSRKGQAFFELEDKKDPLNGGLTLRVRISGQRYIDIRSLSGGEKTLTALAFLFAIQEHEPASFYIFDEVDAALDKHNSEKLGVMIKEYSSRAQYIIISHNDSIISEAENLYGISMNTDGISKVTTLKL